MNSAIFETSRPSFKDVLWWQENESSLDHVVELFYKYHSIYLSDTDNFFEKSYDYCVRSINLLATFYRSDIFHEVLELYKFLVDSDDEILLSACDLYLQKTLCDKYKDMLLHEWQLDPDIYDFYMQKIFILLLQLNIDDKGILELAKKTLWIDQINFKTEITEYLVSNEFEQEIRNRLKYIAPMVKYIVTDFEFDLYRWEWSELGRTWFEVYQLGERVQNDKKIAAKNLEPDDFITAVLGHTDKRSVDIILKRAKKLLPEEKRSDWENYLKINFLDSLPDTPDEWLDLMGVPQEHKEEFLDYYNEFFDEQEEFYTLKKVGRNEPCPCGSGKKYKKCCLIS